MPTGIELYCTTAAQGPFCMVGTFRPKGACLFLAWYLLFHGLYILITSSLILMLLLANLANTK